MNIGIAAERSGVSAKMIRYYEDTGLIPPPLRSEAGYRRYTEADVHRLQFVRRSRDLGFAPADIAALLDLWADRARHSSEVKTLADAHIAALEDKIARLRGMADTLRALVDGCAGDNRPDCPILAGLAPGGMGCCPASAPDPQ